jgi:hypothetical protein
MIIEVTSTIENPDDRQVVILDDSPDDLSVIARLLVKAMLDEGKYPAGYAKEVTAETA